MIPITAGTGAGKHSGTLGSTVPAAAGPAHDRLPNGPCASRALEHRLATSRGNELPFGQAQPGSPDIRFDHVP